MMTYLEIDQALVNLTKQACSACKSRLDAVPRENVTERKALQLEYGMYTFCGNCGLLFNTTGERKIVTIRRRFLEKVLPTYPSWNEVYQSLDEENKMRFVAALQGEFYMRYYWLGEQYAELEGAEATGDVKKSFEFKIKIGAVKKMFAEWEAWRAENGVFPHMFQKIEGKVWA